MESGITEIVSAYRKGMLESDYKLFVKSSFSLYPLLVKPIESWIAGEALIIVPDRVLILLTFDTIIDSFPEGSPGNYKRLRWVLG